MNSRVTIIGGGLAGSAAALELASRDIPVVLHEMRPVKMTPAHTTGELAEPVCSNSFGSMRNFSANGLLMSSDANSLKSLNPMLYLQDRRLPLTGWDFHQQ